jgi:chromate transporter
MTSYSDLIRIFGRIGLLSFGGPAAQIALMHRELVDTRPWLTESQFLRALGFCMLLPGPEAMQLATYAGWRLRGILGGLIAGGLFVLPGALVIALLAALYLQYGALPLVQGAFTGIKALVVVIVVQAILRLSAKALTSPISKTLALLSFCGLFFFDLPFPLIIVLAALIGAMRPDGDLSPAPPPAMASSLRIIATGCLIWAAPLGLAWIFDADRLLEIGLFFSKLAVVTFGGAYAVLAYMTQSVVSDFNWLSTGDMIDALGLAETTPGPLILVTQFVGHLAAHSTGQMLLGGVMALWVTFVPCFIWIFAGAPLIDWLDGQPRLRGALRDITAAVVGVIANLSLWFALHVFFDTVILSEYGPLTLLLPDWPSFNPVAAGLGGLGALLLIWRKVPLWLAMLVLAGLGAMFA